MLKSFLVKILGLLIVFSSITGCDESNVNPEYVIFDDKISLEENVDNYINDLVSSNSPGIAIGVVNKRELLIGKGYGLANIDKKIPITTSSSFYLASVSKQFFSMGVMLLEEQGLLSVNDRISQYFPEFPSDWSNITIHHLLSHQSGIPDYFGVLSDKELFDITNEQVLEWAILNDLNFTPGTQFSYSNTGYIILSTLIERVSKTPIETFMEQSFFDDIGMSNTLVYDQNSKPDIPERVIGYSRNGGLLDYNLLTTGGGGIFSSVEDLLLWSNALDSYSIVEQSTFESAITPYRNKYGYGWFIGSMNDNRLLFHTGGLAGFRTLILKNQETGMTIVMLSNGEVPWLMDLTTKIVTFLQ